MGSVSDDAELWQRALTSDSRAFAAFFDRHRARVYRHALRLLDSTQDADEVMAAAFFELWRLRTRVRVVDGSVLPWLLATATNLSRNRRRGLLRYRSLLARLPHEESEDPVDVAAGRERARRLCTGLGQLRPVDAALLTLTAVEGMSPADAGLVLGLTGTNARTRLQRARLRLRGLLPDLEEGQGS